jgi:hypothetical protein
MPSVVGLMLTLALPACGGDEPIVTVTGNAPAQGSESSVDLVTMPPIREGAVTGYVDNLKVEGQTLALFGWAAAPDLSRPATRVAALVGNKPVAESVPAIKRTDVVEALGQPGLKRSGFELDLPIQSIECGAPAAGVKVIAALSGKSSVLLYGEGIETSITGAC